MTLMFFVIIYHINEKNVSIVFIMVKKVALILFGISSGVKPKTRKPYNTDYKISYTNYQMKLPLMIFLV